MILQRLAEHYDRMEASGVDLPKLGSSRQKISFCIVLQPDGTLDSIEDMRRLEGKSLQPRSMIVPGQSKPPGMGLNPCFLWDNAEYLLGWTDAPERKERAAEAFATSRKMHINLAPSIDVPAYHAVCRFLAGWSPEQGAAFAEQLRERATHFGVFRIAGDQHYVHELAGPRVIVDEGEPSPPAMCLVTGTVGRSARLHEPKVKGVADAQTGGALLVSFNAEAFESYGKTQSFNAPVGEATVFKYANALNHLLEQRDRRIGLGDATVVFWADHAEPVLDACLATLLIGTQQGGELPPQEDEERVRQARVLLTQVRDGTRLGAPTPDGEPTRYYILGLSPNASRLSVRLWIEAEATELERRLCEHLRDVELCSNFDERPLSIRVIANATGRYDAKGKTKFDVRGVSPQLVGELTRSVLLGAPYPQSLLATLVRRIRSDGYIGYERVAPIKACLNRNTRLRGAAMEVPMELDDQRDSIAYRCGRLFALLEKAQADSVEGELNSTVKDRYFSSASATPATVFPQLFRLNNHHLAKLSAGSRVYYGKLFAAAMQAPFHFPRSLDLTQQGEFIVGYFQQQQDLYKKQTKMPEETAA